MPEGYTHVRTARAAAKELHYKIKYPAAFAAGANGPDDLFCFEIWKKAAKRRMDLPALGNRMHEEKTGAFLRSLVTHVHTGPQVEYVLGFLSHYALDTVLHPYVFAMQEPGAPYAGKGGHGYLEIALDSTLHQQDTGEAAVPAEDTSPELIGAELGDVTALLHDSLLEVYGQDVPAEYLADAFYHIWRLRRIFRCRSRLKYAALWLIEPLFGGRGFVTGHLSPRKLKADLPGSWKDPATGAERQGDAIALLAEGESRSCRYMQAALKFWMHQIGEEELGETLGSLSYTTGTATRQSAPELDWPPEETPANAPENAAAAEDSAAAPPEEPPAAAEPKAEPPADPEAPAPAPEAPAEPPAAQQENASEAQPAAPQGAAPAPDAEQAAPPEQADTAEQPAASAPKTGAEPAEQVTPGQDAPTVIDE